MALSSMISILLILLLSNAVFAQRSNSCSSQIPAMVPCLAFVQGVAANPPPTCCSSVSTIGKANPLCLCSLLNNAPVSGVNRTLALQLPARCSINGLNSTLCSSPTAESIFKTNVASSAPAPAPRTSSLASAPQSSAPRSSGSAPPPHSMAPPPRSSAPPPKSSAPPPVRHRGGAHHRAPPPPPASVSAPPPGAAAGAGAPTSGQPSSPSPTAATPKSNGSLITCSIFSVLASVFIVLLAAV